MSPLSRDERFRIGRSLRKKAPREAHATLDEAASRNPVAILAECDSSRVPELVPIRYQRMMESPFAFLRGAASVMAEDLTAAPVSGITVQACGDCHLMNFGAFGTPEENVLFDINDFDESLPGVDFTVDIKRLAASFAVAGFAAGLSKKKARALAVEVTRAYRMRVLALSTLSPLEIWHSRIDLFAEISHFENRALRRRLERLIRRTRVDLDRDDNFPHLVSGETGKILDKPPFIYHFDPDADAQHKLNAELAFATYRESLSPERRVLMERFSLSDVAFKVVGVGSVGTFCAVGLFVDGDGTPLFLQVKEAGRSVLERLSPQLVHTGHQGQRVVEGQRMLQAASDIFLGWTQDEASGRQFYVRQLKNRRLGSVTELVEETALNDYAGLCGRTLARAHARSGDPAMLAGYLGKSGAFDSALADFSIAYAKRTVEDHELLVSARGTAVDPPSPAAQPGTKDQ